MARGDETETVEARGGVGARLRSARERAGLSAIQAAEKLHVDTVVLQALEAEKFDELGAPVYVRGHIRHYADLVRESPAELEDLYGASGHAARLPDLTRVPTTAASDRSPSSLVVPGIVIVIAVALIGMGWWIAGTLSRTAKQRHGAGTAPAAIQTMAPAARAMPAGMRAAGASEPATVAAAAPAAVKPSANPR